MPTNKAMQISTHKNSQDMCVIGREVWARRTTLIRKISLGNHAINHAVGTTIMSTARYANVYTTEAWNKSCVYA